MATRPTLDTVAARARVSRQTVSNVVNAPHLVTQETATRVRAAIDDLKYRPSRAARQLRTNRSMLLGLRLEPDRGGINGAVLDRFLHGVVEAAQAASYGVVVFTAHDDEAEIHSYEALLGSCEADGFLLTSTHRGDPRTSWLAERGVPFSTFGRPWGTADEHHSWVDVDGAAGVRAAVTHLVELGHRRVGFIGWPKGSGVGDDRRSGWSAAVRAAGLPADRSLQALVEDGVSQGRRAAERLLAHKTPPTALVCSSDSLALGAHAVDPAIAVTGFDDTPVARAVGLSSVAQPLVEAAAACVQQVLDVIHGRALASQQVLLPPTFTVRQPTVRQSTVRQSTTPAPAATGDR